MKKIKKLYDLVNKIGETLDGDLHIISVRDYIPAADEKEGEYRVYESSGVCFDVKKEYICEPGEVNQYGGVHDDGFCYSFYAEWDGFKKGFNEDDAMSLLIPYST